MRIAYIISAYKYPNLLIRLVRRLHTQDASFFVHVDKRADDRVYRRIVGGLAGTPRVHFLDRHACDWGGFGHVQATLKAIARIFETQTAFDYAVLLTGQDYPIKSNDAISDYLDANRTTAFLEHFPLPSEQWTGGGLDRIRSWHVRVLGRHLCVPGRRVPPDNLRPYGGSSYWCLPRACIDYVHEFVQHNPEIVRFFRHVDVPDELFFQTILLNSSLRDTVVNDNLRYIEWRDPDVGSPAVLSLEDFDRLTQSSKFFARKFDPTVDEEILDMIDTHILAQPTTERVI